ncbi:MAG TPA: hypothetical protein VF770_01110, partial [Solirubrobacterales bacterium]
RAVEEGVRYAFWRARVWQPRSKDVLRGLGEVEPTAARHVLAFHRAASLEARFDSARALYDCLGMPTGFFEWESEPETLS